MVFGTWPMPPWRNAIRRIFHRIGSTIRQDSRSPKSWRKLSVANRGDPMATQYRIINSQRVNEQFQQAYARAQAEGRAEQFKRAARIWRIDEMSGHKPTT